MSFLDVYIKKTNLTGTSMLNQANIDLILSAAYRDFKEYQIDIDELSLLCEELLRELIKTDLRYESFELWGALQKGMALRSLLRYTMLKSKDDSFTQALLAFESYVHERSRPQSLPNWCT